MSRVPELREGRLRRAEYLCGVARKHADRAALDKLNGALASAGRHLAKAKANLRKADQVLCLVGTEGIP